MSSKTNRANIAIFLGSLLFVFGAYLSLYPSMAGAFPAGPPVEAVDEDDQDAVSDFLKEGKFEEAEEEKDRELMKLAMELKLAEKDLSALLDNEGNQIRFFDPKVNKGLVDRDLLVKLMNMQQALLEDYDKNNASTVKKIEDGNDVFVEDGQKDLDLKDVKLLDDKALMEIALEMKLMENEMDDLMKMDESSRSLFFDPDLNGGLLDRPLLLKLLVLRNGLLDAFDKRFAEF
jgi:hypothetical protein